MIFSLSSECICEFSNTFEATKFNAKLPNLLKTAGKDSITSLLVYDNKALQSFVIRPCTTKLFSIISFGFFRIFSKVKSISYN